MAQRLTDDEKKAIISEIVEYGRANCFLLPVEIFEHFTDYNRKTIGIWIKELYGKTPTEYFEETGALWNLERSLKVKEELNRRYANKAPEKDYESLKEANRDIKYCDRAIWKLAIEEYGNPWLAQPYYCYENGWIKDPIMENKRVIPKDGNFYFEDDEKIIGMQQSVSAKTKDSKKEKGVVRVYDNIDRIDVDALVKKAGINANDDKKFPTSKKYNIERDGKVFEININLKRTIRRADSFEILGFDAIEAMKSMSEPGVDSGSGAWNEPYYTNNPKANPELAGRRVLFLKAIGAMLSNQDILEAIVDFIPKKKDGTFVKRKVIRIANSMVGYGGNQILEITARVKDDTHAEVAFEEASAIPETYERSCNDFVCNYWNQFFK